MCVAYDLSPDLRIVRALPGAYRTVVGRGLRQADGLTMCGVNVIVREAGISAVSHGTVSTTTHADLEWVELPNIVGTPKVFAATIMNYLGLKRSA